MKIRRVKENCIYKFATKAVHAGEDSDTTADSIAIPIYETSSFSFDSVEQGAARFAGKEEGYIYTRLGNPTTRALERSVAELENGEDARACASGMAAITTTLMSIVKKGDHVVATDCLYGGTLKLFLDILPQFGIDFTLIDSSDAANIKAAVRENTRLIYVETPSNPILKLTDIRETVKIAAEFGLLTVVDNTFMSPCLQRPIDLGADIVIHSLTKSLSGHSDVIGGIVVGSRSFLKTFDPILKNTGPTLGPFEAWLTLRGIKTLPIRMEKHNENAMRIAGFLEGHLKIERVYYPGR